jgi:hypothetical protein
MRKLDDRVLTLLEELDDRKIVQEWLPKLKVGPFSSGALRWEEVREEWASDLQGKPEWVPKQIWEPETD